MLYYSTWVESIKHTCQQIFIVFLNLRTPIPRMPPNAPKKRSIGRSKTTIQRTTTHELVIEQMLSSTHSKLLNFLGAKTSLFLFHQNKICEHFVLIWLHINCIIMTVETLFAINILPFLCTEIYCEYVHIDAGSFFFYLPFNSS